VRSKSNLLGGDRFPLAVTGRGLVSAAGLGLESLAGELAFARSHLGPLSRQRGIGEPAVGGEVPAALLGAAATGPGGGRAFRLAALALGEALAEALGPGLTSAEIGLALGTALGPVETVEERAGSDEPLDRARLSAAGFGVFAANLAASAGLLGPKSVFSSTCVSGLCALEQAAADLALSRSRAMAVGALDTLGLVMQSGFSCLKALSPTGRLQPFDAAHDGIVLGEGASFVILESLRDARERGAKVQGCLLSQRLVSDCFHFTSPDPSGEGMARAISEALSDAGLSAADLGCITVSAAGSPVYDRMLSVAVEKALGREAASRIPVTTWEPAVGHLLAATGIAAVVHASWLLEEGRVHPVFNVETLDPECRLCYVLGSPTRLSSPVVLTLVVGFGGQNGAGILASPEAALDLVPRQAATHQLPPPPPAASRPRPASPRVQR
jgi:3-oxoacyl-[acyl-carrier-protein] synthase II